MTDAKHTKRVESPFEEWPGYLVIPTAVTPLQFDRLWKRIRATKDAETHYVFTAYETRLPLIIEWGIEGIERDATLEEMPPGSTRFMNWVATLLNPVLADAFSLPNSPGPSSDTGTP